MNLHELEKTSEICELMIKGFKVDRVACEIDGVVH